MIKNFSQFLNESSDQDFKVADMLATVTRFYESRKNFYTDELQFIADEEHRDWEDTREDIVLEEEKKIHGKYTLKYKLNEKKYVLNINFLMTFNGSKEKDAPETAPETELNRLNLVLEDLKIKNLSLKSQSMDYSSSSPSQTVEHNCMRFLIKMLANDYDTLGEKLFSIEEQ
jgi:hypothetical protein